MNLRTRFKIKIKHRIKRFLINVSPLQLGLSLFLILIGTYFLQFGGWPWIDYLSLERDEWGQFGDFVGGVLNPLLALVTIWLLTRSLAQNNRMLKQAALELRMTRDEIVRGISIQDDARRALELEVKYVRADKVKGELEAVITHWESELDRIATVHFYPPLRLSSESMGEIENFAFSSFLELEQAGFRSTRMREIIEQQERVAPTMVSLQMEAFDVVDSMSRATQGILDCLETEHYKSYWSNRFLISAMRVVSWKAFDNEKLGDYKRQFAVGSELQ